MSLEFKIKSGQKNSLAVESNTLLIELEIDPKDTDSQNDKYTLFCSDDESIYKKMLTVKDDHVPGDEFLTLKFLRIVSGHKYTLEVDPRTATEPYYLFEDIPLEDLLSGKFHYEGSGEEEEDKEFEQVYDESEDALLPYDDSSLDDEEQLAED